MNEMKDTIKIINKNRSYSAKLKRSFSITVLIMMCCLLGSACPSANTAESPNKEKLIKSSKTVKKANPQDQQTAEQAVANFHQLFNDKKYDDMFALVDENAKPMRSRDEFVNLMTNLHNKLGKVTSKQLLQSKTVQQETTTAIELLYKTTYENGNKRESFKWVITNGTAKLYSYSQPPEQMPLFKKKNK